MAMHGESRDVPRSEEPLNPPVDPPAIAHSEWIPSPLPIERIPTSPLPETTSPPPSEMVPADTVLSPPPIIATPVTPVIWHTAGADTTIQATPPASKNALPASMQSRFGSLLPAWQQLRANRRNNIWLLAIVLLLILSLLYGLVLRNIIPASSAVLHITPKSRNIVNSFALTAVTGTTDGSATQISIHQLMQESPAKSVTVPATGHVHLDATKAHGTVNVTVLQGSVVNLNIHILSTSGVGLTINIGTLGTGQSGSFFASVDNAGAGGNIPANDINGNYNDSSGANIISAQNPAAFSAGQDARDATAVQQSDIDSATQQVESQFTATDTTTIQNATQSLLTATERLVDPIQCTPNPSADQQVNAAADTLTVSATILCTGVAYDTQTLLTTITPLLTNSATTQLGDGYALVGQILLATVSSGGRPLLNGQMTLNVTAEGIWAYQFNNTQQRTLASLITGKRYEDALTLLKQQRGIAAVSIQTSGFPGIALPASTEAIQTLISPIKGL